MGKNEDGIRKPIEVHMKTDRACIGATPSKATPPSSRRPSSGHAEAPGKIRKAAANAHTTAKKKKRQEEEKIDLKEISAKAQFKAAPWSNPAARDAPR